MTIECARKQRRFAGANRIGDRPTGMTLVELLVVLGMTSILAAIVFPVFRYGIVSAQRTSCINNERQISMALSLYVEDYDRTFPSFRIDPDSAARPEDYVYWYNHFCRGVHLLPRQVAWSSVIAPYTSLFGNSAASSDVFFCPADSDRIARPVTSYEFKMWLAQGRQLTEVADPSAASMVWEQWAYHLDPVYNEHDRRAALNVGFVDGHVKWIRLADTTNAFFGDDPDLRWPHDSAGQ